MTEDYLLSKEEEFRQLNKQLEHKAQDLVKEIDSVINTCNNGKHTVSNAETDYVNRMRNQIDCSRNENNAQSSIRRNCSSSLSQIFDQFTTTSSKPNVEIERSTNEDEAFKRTTLANKAVLNTFKAKIDMLQDELHTLRIEYRKKCDTCKDLESDNKRIETLSKKEIESLKETVSKLESSTKGFQSELQALNTENAALRKELDKFQKELKTASQQSNNYIMRLNRALENNDKLKSALKCTEIEEKELKIQMRRLQEEKRSSVSSLGKQLSEVIQVFKKQMLIVDNLKKQNACLVAIGQLDFTKQDFSRLLDQKVENL
ncbi:MAR-binding filament-like protein 1-1 [Ceratina calcarata]|uniref:MAR-binding filament-like protein 1-1 n=1 Tax=Ceratina calcarata TaxID=156304 RepID=A0AAJ7J5L7_9HYME|nr:MAR-binding filament-like protein 1-1 [Ceratina calcarata]